MTSFEPDINLLAEAEGKLLDHAFLTAVMLTGSVQGAEAVLLEVIDYWSPNDPLDGKVLDGVIVASLAWGNCESSVCAEKEHSALTAVPAGLRGVLILPPHLRRCFVLRMLLRMDKQEAAELLGMGIDEITRCTSAAMRRLPTLQARMDEDLEFLTIS